MSVLSKANRSNKRLEKDRGGHEGKARGKQRKAKQRKAKQRKAKQMKAKQGERERGRGRLCKSWFMSSRGTSSKAEPKSLVPILPDM